ncbi:hypothetical protein [Pseudoalteromonas aurantia]|uniref:DUF1579 domain-containing protein n=1 Tax=Pseudoalteromonas aurantia 208 TaxID=1314867 RepID=A0ABR9EG78_9GAMM|nr:hypothetical protein [Pseudoalteromonas aurantia 208]
MNRVTKSLYSWVIVMCFGVTAHGAENETLVDELVFLQPFLGGWQADFAVPVGKPAMQDVSHWERALNGTAVRTLHSINAGMYGGESLIFWDDAKQEVVFYYFTTASFYTQGTIKRLSDGGFAAYETVTGSEEGITQVKSTTRYIDNTMQVSTQYLKQQQWTAPQRRTYTRSTQQVIFK